MKIAAIVFTLFAGVAFSQTTANQGTVPEPNAFVTKVIRVRYGNAKTLSVLATQGTDLGVSSDNLLQVIVLRGRAHVVADVERAIRELDVPTTTQIPSKSKNIELVVSIIGGSEGAEIPSGSPIPGAMAPVVKQLQAVFPYKNYQLLSSMLLRSSGGAKAENKGAMKNLINSAEPLRPSGYTVSYDEVNISTEEGKPAIHLRNFYFGTVVQVQPNVPMGVEIRTDVDLREGQKVVAGKANLGNSDLAFFVVLSARIVE